MRVKETLVGLKPYEPGKPIEEVQRELGLSEVIKLASNENPYGCSKKVKDALKNAFDDLAIYPDGYARVLRERVAKHINVKETELIFGNGSDEVILILCRALLSEGDNIVTAKPTFSQYKHNAVIEGAEIKEVPLVDGVHDLEAMVQAIDENTKIVFVCNPNNPTGTYVGKEAFLSFLERVPKDVLVVSDEAYYEYVEAEDYPETIPLIKDYPNLVVLRTFSKAYGLAALRVGYGVGNEDFIRSIEPAREPFNNNTLGQRAAKVALDDQAFIKDCFGKNREEMKRMEVFCEEMGFTYYPSQTNFMLIDVKKQGGEVFQKLLEQGIIVRNGEAFGFSTSIRLTLGTKEQNDRVMDALRNLS